MLLLFLGVIIQVWVSCSQNVCRLTSQGTHYVLYNEDRIGFTWDQGRDKCIKEGQILASPPLLDEDAIALRRDIINSCGDYMDIWLSARGNGTQFVTQPGSRVISNTSPLWVDGHPGTKVTTQHCMQMVGWVTYLEDQTSSPYFTLSCLGDLGFPLCQVCSDKEAECQAKASTGLCDKNADYMYSTCPLACKHCDDPGCVDKDADCKGWATSGLCEKDAAFMLDTCPLACKFCGCIDKDAGCQGWANTGLCKKNANFMKSTCPLACKLCSE